MQVVWLDEAKVLFKEAISFGFLAFGEKAVIRFVDEVQRTNERLSVFPRLGKIEPALRGLKSIAVWLFIRIIRLFII